MRPQAPARRPLAQMHDPCPWDPDPGSRRAAQTPPRRPGVLCTHCLAFYL